MEARVLVVHDNAGYVGRLVALCRDRDIQIGRPAATAGRSLPDERDGASLVDRLRSRWGMQARVIDSPDPGELLRELRL